MNEFKLSDGIDKDKIFLISHKNKNDRLDPYYYLPKFDILKLKLLKSGFELKYLNEICDINRGGSPRPIQNYLTNNEDGINWIKIGDTKKVDKYIYTTKQKIKPEGVRYSRTVYEGDFILSNSMSFGKPYIMKTTGCIHDGWLLLRKKDDSITDDYLYSLLSSNIMYQLFKQSTIGGVVDNLNIDLVKKIKIPIPNKSTQKNIVDSLNNGISKKQQKEKQAKDLLDSIDIYLLDELGITLPKIDNSLEKRIFEISLSDISGGRFDCDYYSLKFKNILKTFNTAKYEFSILKDILVNIKTGTTPSQALKPFTKNKEIPFLRNSNIQNGEIISNSFKYIKSGLENYLTFSNKNEIIVCIAGTIGISALNNIGELAINQNVSSIAIDEKKINPQFLIYWLNTKLAIQLLKRLASIATISYVNNEALLKLQIPLPPIEKQNEMAEHIQAIRDTAKQLKTEAVQDLKNAKLEVEKMILGQ
jgi:restriction endonuclease S subunit